ncbi:MAG: hypothetical protein BJ554DRAFT_5600 [Olpidium bornovanus]|uniref:Signal recognition particle subunit SRP72 n=1 Tax=Olpidium bornovanus TaxID=278681 RepID=A0A8H7ZZC5_9FUNG|nr:MAG: hypothetical protein BJ554DRAFT_5600 [Olpidium bornovanus]
MTNFAAVRAAAAMSKRSVPIEALPKSKLETHEQLYNAACEALARDDLVNAEKHLDRAQFVCSNLSVDHFTSEEKEQELAPILVQKSYIAQMRGLDSDFAKTYQEVISSRNADEAISAVASNNLVACYGCKDLFDSAKKLRAANAEKLQHRLLRSQRATMAANLASLYLKMKKVSEARSLANRLSEQFPDSEAANLVLASCALFQKQPGKALEELAELARMRPGSVAICFARVQLLVAQGLYDQSLQVLEGAKLTSRAAVRLRIWLLEQLGRKEEVVGALKRAAEEAGEADVRRPNKLTYGTPASLTRELAKIKLASGRTREAVSDYERVLRNDPSDVQALAGLVVAIAAFDVAKANEYARGLPDLPLDMADAGMDVASLESIVPGAKKYYLRKAAADGGNAVELKKKKKKARKPLLPKNYDPNVLPDPERWLRKDLRTSARKKGKGRANVALKGPQGAAVGGGGVGSTGSANIHGMKSKPAPAPVSEQVSAKSDVASDAAEVTKSRGGGAAGSGGGGGGGGKNKKKDRRLFGPLPRGDTSVAWKVHDIGRPIRSVANKDGGEAVEATAATDAMFLQWRPRNVFIDAQAQQTARWSLLVAEKRCSVTGGGENSLSRRACKCVREANDGNPSYCCRIIFRADKHERHIFVIFRVSIVMCGLNE